MVETKGDLSDDVPGRGAVDAIDAGEISIDGVRAACELAMKENKVVWFTIDDDSVDPELVAGIIEGRCDASGHATSKTG